MEIPKIPDVIFKDEETDGRGIHFRYFRYFKRGKLAFCVFLPSVSLSLLFHLKCPRYAIHRHYNINKHFVNAFLIIIFAKVLFLATNKCDFISFSIITAFILKITVIENPVLSATKKRTEKVILPFSVRFELLRFYLIHVGKQVDTSTPTTAPIARTAFLYSVLSCASE